MKLDGPRWLRAHLPRFLQELGLPASPLDSVTIEGDDPQESSVHHLGALMALAHGAQAAALACAIEGQGGPRQACSLQLAEVVARIFPEHTGLPQCQHRAYPDRLLRDNPFLTSFYRTHCGQFFVPSALYPDGVYAWLRALDVSPQKSRVADAIGTWDGLALEAFASDQGLPGALCRTPEAWRQTTQGTLEKDLGWVDVTAVTSAKAMPQARKRRQINKFSRPLEGLRVLTFCRAIAGSVLGRTLAEYGADVVSVIQPNSFEHDAVHFEVGIGSRSVAMDLSEKHDLTTVLDWAQSADVIVDNLRHGALLRRGINLKSMAARRDDVVVASIRTYDERGPWASRPGFDMNAMAATGMAYAEGAVMGQAPRLPPTRLFCDYAAGALAAAGVLSALARQAREGGSYVIHTSLSRAAMACQALGLVEPAVRKKRVVNPTLAFDSPWGPMLRFEPLQILSRTKAFWDTSRLQPRGQMTINQIHWSS